MRTRVAITGVLLFSVGLAICAYAALGNLQEHPCSGTCNLVTTGNSTHVVCPSVPGCNYAGVPASTVWASGILLSIIGIIIVGAGMIGRSHPK